LTSTDGYLIHFFPSFFFPPLHQTLISHLNPILFASLPTHSLYLSQPFPLSPCSSVLPADQTGKCPPKSPTSRARLMHLLDQSYFFFFFFSEKIHYNFQSPNFLSNKSLLSGRKTEPKGILFLLFLLSVKFLQQHSRISNPIQFSEDSRIEKLFAHEKPSRCFMLIKIHKNSAFFY